MRANKTKTNVIEKQARSKIYSASLYKKRHKENVTYNNITQIRVKNVI